VIAWRQRERHQGRTEASRVIATERQGRTVSSVVRILLIDDNDVFRKMVRLTLTANGYDVQEAENGKVALACYRQQPCDVVITDILMPEADGLEIIQKLRLDDPNVAIIAISGAGGERGDNFLKMAAVFGANRILRKPFPMDELLAVIADVLIAPRKDTPGA
jgi:DNA-binding response OmpR family regulator